MSEVPVFLQFWGKAQPFEGMPSGWHPVAYHSLDVAACTEAILRTRPLARAKAASLLRCTEDEAVLLCRAMASLHDLGKFSRSFQSKVPVHWPAALGPLDPTRIVQSPHTIDGYALWKDVIGRECASRLWADASPVDIKPLMQAVFGHHGRPVPSHGSPVQRVFGDQGIAAAHGCALALLGLLMPSPVDGGVDLESLTFRASWWIAGLITVADWIGSHQEWFPYHGPRLSVGDYWAVARAGALHAVRKAGVVAPRAASPSSFQQLTRIETPTPAQEWATSVQLPNGPVLVILEDVTGSGKTEAAQMLVHRLMSEGRAAGVYWAMPTQATANAMYTRQHEAIEALFDAGSEVRPSLVLAHSQSRLHEDFRATVLSSDASMAAREDTRGVIPDDISSTYWCAAFLADDRRASLLADVGSGTVDQALLAALPSKFNTVRLFGLADRVLVVDEAHAYDSFTATELRGLLAFQAALGGHAVVLSATLTFEKRMELAAVWRDNAHPESSKRGRSFSNSISSEERQRIAYPLATIVSGEANGTTEHALTAAPWSHRRVEVTMSSELEPAIAQMIAAVERGGAVAWVRNTVGSCLDGAELLRARGLDPEVFHARFAQCDRQARERDVMTRFGKDAPPDARRGRILVATQVIEQSLDLDFDLLVTDLAPVDLLIQRAGRLWRHSERDASRPISMKREMLVISPLPTENVDAGWLKALLPGTDRVYANAAILWRTARVLDMKRAIETPSGCRELIESVYFGEDCPDGLVASTGRATGTAHANAAVANYGTLKLADGYNGDSTAWIDDMRIPTRLGEAQTTLRLSKYGERGALQPWARGSHPEWKAWALSELRVYQSRIPPDSEIASELLERAASVRSTWGRFEQESILLPLVEAESGEWLATLRDPRRKKDVLLRYDTRDGLRFA